MKSSFDSSLFLIGYDGKCVKCDEPATTNCSSCDDEYCDECAEEFYNWEAIGAVCDTCNTGLVQNDPTQYDDD